MGTDIHWVIERQHRDGAWEAVASKTRVYEIGERIGIGRLPYNHPWKRIGRRNYPLFAALSNIRFPDPDHHIQVAAMCVPTDASPYVALNFDGEEVCNYHSQGHFTLGTLRTVAATDPHGCATTDKEREALRTFGDHVEAVLDGPSALPLDDILFGPEYDEDGDGEHPAMKAESNHARLLREARGKELLPIEGDTLRFIVGYDN